MAATLKHGQHRFNFLLRRILMSPSRALKRICNRSAPISWDTGVDSIPIQ